MSEYIRAFVDKYIFHRRSPARSLFGYDYEWDYLKAKKEKERLALKACCKLIERR